MKKTTLQTYRYEMKSNFKKHITQRCALCTCCVYSCIYARLGVCVPWWCAVRMIVHIRACVLLCSEWFYRKGIMVAFFCFVFWHTESSSPLPEGATITNLWKGYLMVGKMYVWARARVCVGVYDYHIAVALSHDLCVYGCVCVCVVVWLYMHTYAHTCTHTFKWSRVQYFL